MENENVNHPKHYSNFCSLECIEVMELIYGKKSVFEFCKLNAFKYIWRYKGKNGKEDLEKAIWYCKEGESILESIKKTLTSNKYQKEKEEIRKLQELINVKITKEIK